VVLVTSGYNNVDRGDGRGYLYVLERRDRCNHPAHRDFLRRARQRRAGCARSTLFVNNYVVRTTRAERVVWGRPAGQRLALRYQQCHSTGGLSKPHTCSPLQRTLSGKAQPITTRPELAEVNGTTMVMVATGSMLSTDDLTDTSRAELSMRSRIR
jgi:hypothetical protein